MLFNLLGDTPTSFAALLDIRIGYIDNGVLTAGELFLLLDDFLFLDEPSRLELCFTLLSVGVEEFESACDGFLTRFKLILNLPSGVSTNLPIEKNLPLPSGDGDLNCSTDDWVESRSVISS